MAFEQKLQNTQNAKIEKVYFSVNLNLDHSDVTLQNTFLVVISKVSMIRKKSCD